MMQLDEILDEETRRKVYEFNLLMLSMNTHSEMQIWLYIILVAGQLEYLAVASLLLHAGKDPKIPDFWKSEEHTTLGQATNKLNQKQLFPSEIIENMRAISRLRNSAAHKNLLRGVTKSAVYKGKDVFQDKEAFGQLMDEASAVVQTLHSWLRQHNPYAETNPC
jgi:hypothetical protein